MTRHGVRLVLVWLVHLSLGAIMFAYLYPELTGGHRELARYVGPTLACYVAFNAFLAAATYWEQRITNLRLDRLEADRARAASTRGGP